MKENNENVSSNQQPHSRQEGQQNNIRPREQQLHDTNAQGLTDMKQDSAEQKAGREHEQKDESTTQRGERHP